MESMVLQELLMLVLSIAALVGGTACVIRRDKRFASESNADSSKQNTREARDVGFSPQRKTA